MKEINKPVKVFISHDSRDKKRFVDNFAKKLRNNGIDAWYDKWELALGDSLMNIFDEIAKCDVFITIISKNSVTSNWVKEESDSGFINKINKKCRFIPIILSEDNVQIPSQFEHLIQCRIENIQNYDSEFKELLSDILDIDKKPPLGSNPQYILEQPINNLEVIDTMIIKSLGANALKNGNIRLNFEDIDKLTHEEFSSKYIQESLEILKDENYINYKTYSNSHKPRDIKLTFKGIICYGENYIPNFDEITKDIISLIINDNVTYSKTFFEKIESSKVIIRAIVEKFSEESYLTLQQYTNGSFKISKINGKGKRQLKKILDAYKTEKYQIPNCTIQDTEIFKVLGDYCTENGFDSELDPLTILDECNDYSENEIAHSLNRLTKYGYLKSEDSQMGMAFTSKSFTNKGFCTYFKKYIPNYKEIYKNIITSIYQDKIYNLNEISDKNQVNEKIVEELLNLFKNKEHIIQDNQLNIIEIIPEGNDYFNNYLNNH